MTDLNGDGVTAAAKDLGISDNAVPLQMDVTQEQHWANVAKLAIDRFGRIDILVNNGMSASEVWIPEAEAELTGVAGTTYPNKPTLDVTGAEFDRVFNVNVRSIFLSIQAVVPQMKKQGGGSIINVSSIGSIRPRGGLVWYNASKGAVTNVCEPLV